MGKNSPFPPDDRRPSDGAISVRRIGPALQARSDEPLPDEPDLLSFLLDDVPSDVLDFLAVGEEVDFLQQGSRIAVRAAARRIGYVPRPHAGMVEPIIAVGGHTAWVSELPHRAVEVTIKS